MRTVLGWLTRPVPLARLAAFRALVYAFVIWDVLFNFDDVIDFSLTTDGLTWIFAGGAKLSQGRGECGRRRLRPCDIRA